MNHALAGTCLLLALGLAACTRPNTNTAAANAMAMRPASAGAGIILSIRAVVVPSDGAPWRAGFLADASAATAAGDSGSSTMMEFIVRSDDGATISVVQSNELGLRVADRVTILRDTRTHLVRPSGT